MRLRRYAAIIGTVVLTLSIVPAAALAADAVQHGIGVTKGCASPVKIGDPYACSYSVRNVVDEAEDTLTIDSFVDVVEAASGDVSSGNILGTVQITVTGGASCAAASGDGSPATPYTGVTECTLPFGGRVNVLTFSHYTVKPGDFGLPSHQLKDNVRVGWNDLCDDPADTNNTNCDTTPPDATASSLAVVQKLASSTATEIHDADHEAVTQVSAGATVHDLVTVTGQPGQPKPSGKVTIDWFTNDECTGNPADTSGLVGPLDNGEFDATGFSQGPLPGGGHFSFKAHYPGDDTYTASNGDCEPLSTVKLDSSTVTEIHDADHEVVTEVAAGAVVHDFVMVTGQPGKPKPTGKVNIDWFENGECSGEPTSNSGSVGPLDGDGEFDATGFSQGPLAGEAQFAFKAHYEGDSNYKSSTGDCEPLETKAIVRLISKTATEIHSASHAVIIGGEEGDFVHDFVTVTGQPDQPVPTGMVTFAWFENATCAGDPAEISDSLGPLDEDGEYDATSFTQGPLVADGLYAFQAYYEGDAAYQPSLGECEPLFTGGTELETSPPSGPPTDTLATTSTDGSGSVPLLLIILGILGLAAVVLTPSRAKR